MKDLALIHPPATEGTEIALLSQPITAVTLFKRGGVADVLAQMEADVRRQRFDASKPADRAAAKSYIYKLRRSKTAMDGLGKDLNASKRAEIDGVDADRRIIREKIDAWISEIEAPIVEAERIAQARIDAHEKAILEMTDLGNVRADETPNNIRFRQNALTQFESRDWQEFRARASDIYARVWDGLAAAHAAAVKREAEAAELAAFRAAQAEAAAKAEQERQAKERAELARKAAEAARVQAEQEARAEAERVAREHQAAMERAERDRLAAEEAAARREREHRDAAARAERQARQAEADRIAAAEQAERDRIAAQEAAERRQKEAVAAAERRAREEQERRDREAQAARDAAAAEAQRRAADHAHQQTINRAALAALMEAGLSEAAGKLAIAAIAQGKVPAVSISY